MLNVAIDRKLSVYGMLSRLNTTQQQTLVRQRWTMNAISYEIENMVLLDGLRGRVFSSFQRMSRFLPQIPRYRQIAQRAESVYVMGIMDVDLPNLPNIHYIALPADAQLTKEWFVILDAPELACTLATEEISAPNAHDSERQFKGLWTFNREMTSLLQEWLTSLFDANPLPTTTDHPDTILQAALIAKIGTRLQARTEKAIQRAQAEASDLQDSLRQAFNVSQKG